jgi:hypothetical protein
MAIIKNGQYITLKVEIGLLRTHNLFQPDKQQKLSTRTPEVVLTEHTKPGSQNRHSELKSVSQNFIHLASQNN